MDDNTLYKINYWELPGHHKSTGYFFRYCLGSSAVIYLFDGNYLKFNKKNIIYNYLKSF